MLSVALIRSEQNLIVVLTHSTHSHLLPNVPIHPKLEFTDTATSKYSTLNCSNKKRRVTTHRRHEFNSQLGRIPIARHFSRRHFEQCRLRPYGICGKCFFYYFVWRNTCSLHMSVHCSGFHSVTLHKHSIPVAPSLLSSKVTKTMHNSCWLVEQPPFTRNFNLLSFNRQQCNITQKSVDVPPTCRSCTLEMRGLIDSTSLS